MSISFVKSLRNGGQSEFGFGLVLLTTKKKYREVKASYSDLLSSKKSAYFSTKIQENEYNQASLYKIVNKIARKPDAKPYPDHIPELALLRLMSATATTIPLGRIHMRPFQLDVICQVRIEVETEGSGFQ